MVDITGLDKAAVLAALYNASKPQGMGFMHYDPKPMTTEEAAKILADGSPYFDYLKGRVMKIDLKSDTALEERLYDRDNGTGKAAFVIDELRRTGSASTPAIDTVHRQGKLEAADKARDLMGQQNTTSTDRGVPTFTMGLQDAAPHLGPAVDKALKD